jgi:PAS domain S-box-containing protein
MGSTIQRYIAAVAAVLLAWGLKRLLDPYLAQEGAPFLFLSVAIMASAAYGGLGPGLVSLGLAALVGYRYFLPPEYRLIYQDEGGSVVVEGPGQYLWLSMFVLEGLLICVLAAALHAARRRAETSHGEAERAYEESQDVLGALVETKEALQTAEARFRRLVDANIIGVLFANYSQGRLQIVDANDAFLRMVGYSRDDLQGGRVAWAALLPEDSTADERGCLEELQTEGICQPFEWEFIRRDGQRVPVLFGAARLAEPTHEAICFAMDLSEQKQAERELQDAISAAEEASRAKSQFLANISHELRTPMNAILGMTGLALEEDLAPPADDYLRTVRDSAEVLMELLNEILDFARLEAGKFVLDSAPLRLRPLLAESIKSLAPAAHRKRLELHLHVPADVPDALVGDAARLRQILGNLAGNAIKFTERGEVVIAVAAESQSEGQAMLRFSVSDTGIGISPQDRQRIFAPFTQADASMTRRFGGTGLGLAIATELCQMMGGRLWVESELGQGSTFHASVRLAIHEGESQTAPVPAALAELRGARVLVADGQATNRQVIADLLRNWSLEPIEAADGPAALERIEQAADSGQRIRLALLDARLPESDGISLAGRILQEGQLAEAVVLMISPPDRRALAPQLARLGAATILEKPILEAELAEALISAMSGAPGVAVHDAETAGPARRLKILLAEDMPANQKVVANVLKKRGHAVRIADNGRTALDLIRRQRFDLVLMDIQMPVMDGFQATSAIRSLDCAPRAHTPIVALTAHAMRGDRQRCLDAGMDAYIAKPIDPRKLIELVELLGTGTGPEAATAADRRAAPDDGHAGTGGSTPAGAICNLDAALHRMGGDRDLLEDLIRFFQEDSPGLLEQIWASLREQKSEDLERYAHTLKGLTANFDAVAAVSAAQRVEDLARSGDREALKQAIVQLQREVKRLDQALRQGRK